MTDERRNLRVSAAMHVSEIPFETSGCNELNLRADSAAKYFTISVSSHITLVECLRYCGALEGFLGYFSRAQ